MYLVLARMAPTVQLAHLYKTPMNVALGSTAPREVPHPNPAQQDYLPTHQEETGATHVLRASTVSLWNLHEMNPLDTVSVQEGTIVLREQVLIGVHAQRVHIVTGLACTLRSNVRTVMLVNSVTEGTSHLQQISVQLDITAG